MIHRYVLCFFIASSLLPSARSELLVYEPFDYPEGHELDSNTRGGLGWDGGWYGDEALTDSTTGAAITDNIFAAPAGVAVLGNSLGFSGAREATRAFAPENRINMDVAGTHYFSVLGRYNGELGSNWHFQLLDANAATVAFFRSAGSSGNASIRLLNPSEFNGDVTDTLPSTADGDFLWVGKLTTTPAGDDQFDAWLFHPGEAIPDEEPAPHGSNAYPVSGTLIDRLHIYKGAPGETDGFDEIRFATTWDSATAAIPEPAHFALAFGLLGILGVALRRFTRRG